MLKEYVPKRLAKQLKDLGFDSDCQAWWFEESEISVPTQTRGFCKNWNRSDTPLRISAPFWQQANAWFRERHNIIASIGCVSDPFPCFEVTIYDLITFKEIHRINTYSYDIAGLICLEQLIEIVKERNSINSDINKTDTNILN